MNKNNGAIGGNGSIAITISDEESQSINGAFKKYTYTKDKAMSDTKKEYEIGCYYEFSDTECFVHPEVGKLERVCAEGYQSKCGNKTEWFIFIRELTAPAGKITKPKPLSGFVNVYQGSNVSTTWHKRRGMADSHSLHHVDRLVACIDLSQFNEGEGL